jgi:hypothetical protein
MGLALARLVCDEVGIRAGAGGTTVMLRMSLLARRGGPRKQAPSCPRRALLRFAPAGRAGRLAAGVPAGRDFRRNGA